MRFRAVWVPTFAGTPRREPSQWNIIASAATKCLCNGDRIGHVSSRKSLYARPSGEQQGGSMIRLLIGAMAFGALVTAAFAADPVEIRIGYLGRAGIKPTLSLVQQPADNDGVAGARLAIEDNNTTGRFQNQRFALDEIRLKG